jgi:hypothetical protein
MQAEALVHHTFGAGMSLFASGWRVSDRTAPIRPEENMTVKQLLSAAVVVALVGGMAPVSAWADESATTSGTSASLHSSIDRAAARLAIDRPAQKSVNARKEAGTSASAMQASGGGGGHAMMIISLVTAAAGIGATYYMVKQMQKTTDNLNIPK